MPRRADLAAVRSAGNRLIRIEAGPWGHQQELGYLDGPAPERPSQRDAQRLPHFAPACEDLVGADLATGADMRNGAARQRDAVDRGLAVIDRESACSAMTCSSRWGRPS